MTTLHRLRKLAPEEFGTRFSPGAWARLAKHYGCPPRAYHNLEHILSFAEWFHTLEGEWQRPSEVFAALLFHDAIYDALATNNESRSASLACEALAHIELDLELVARLIRSSDPTAPRPSTPLAQDLELFLDCDRAILGAPRDDYMRYAEGVAREYAALAEPVYRQGRGAFLRRELERSSLFSTALMRERLEARARANLSWELERLRA